MKSKIFNSKDRGYILITALLLLLVLTIVGIAAINTSTVENILSGNIKLREENVSSADAGVEISTAVIERCVRAQDTQGFTNIINPVSQPGNPDYLPMELRSSAFDPDAQDIAFQISNQNVSVDIDKMYSRWMGGTAIEFASGYEGTGKSGGKGFITYYRINSNSTGMVSSAAEIGAIYRYVPKY